MTIPTRLAPVAGLSKVRADMGINYLSFADVLRRAGNAEEEMSSSQFHEFLSTAVKNFQVSPSWLGSTYRYSKTSVSRWVSGETAPVPYMRTQIVMGMAEFIEKIGQEMVEYA